MDNQIEVLWHETGLGTLRSIGMDEYLYHPEEPGGNIESIAANHTYEATNGQRTV